MNNQCNTSSLVDTYECSKFCSFLPKSYCTWWGALVYWLDIILVKGLSKHTLNTYFSGVKIYPKYVFLHAFFFICPIMSFPKFVNMTKTHPFSNFACFCTPKWCTRVQCLVLKNNPNYVNFFTRMISTFEYKWPPTEPLREMAVC